MRAFHSHLSYANVVATVALVIAVGGGAAYAANTIFSEDIINGGVKTPDLGQGAVTTGKLGANSVNAGKVVNDTLTGADINESLLGPVPLATLGGLGRSTGTGNGCDPESATLVSCGHVDFTLPAESHVLVLGRVRAIAENGASAAYGSCNIGTSWTGPLTSSSVSIYADSSFFSQVPLQAVTPLVGPGFASFGIDCNEDQTQPGAAIRYDFAQVTAVALAPD